MMRAVQRRTSVCLAVVVAAGVALISDSARAKEVLETPAYELVLSRAGGYTVGTGADHPVTLREGARQNVMTGGFAHITQLSATSLRSYSSRRDYYLTGGSRIFDRTSGFACSAWPDLEPDSIGPYMENGREVGLEAVWLIDSLPDQFELHLRLKVHGQGFEDGAVEVTTTVSNNGDQPLRIGVRYLWGVHIRTGLHPSYGFVPPTPAPEPFLEDETEFLSPGFESFLASWPEFPSQEEYFYFNAGSITGPRHLEPPPTPPDRIILGPDGAASERVWNKGPGFQGVGNSCFAYTVLPGADLRGDSTITSWWGPTEASAIHIEPGESAAVTQYIWSFRENPVICDAGGPYAFECTGGPTLAILDGTGSTTQEGNPVLHFWESTDPRVIFREPEAARPEIELPGVGRYKADLRTAIGPYVEDCTTDIEVVDTMPPELEVPAPATLRTSDSGPEACELPWTVTAVATDLCAADTVITHTTVPDIGSGGAVASYDFPPGTTRILFRAVDPTGNVTTKETTVTVVDDTPPVFERLQASPDLLWPPNHKLVEIAVDAAIRDNCDPAPRVELSYVASNEPEDAGGDGHTSPDILDIELGKPDFQVQLRAERDGRGEGRIYFLEFAAVDDAGNVTAKAIEVNVPHDRRP